MVFSLTTQNYKYQSVQFNPLLSIGMVKANVYKNAQIGLTQPQIACMNVVPLAANVTNLANAVAATTGPGYVPLTAGTGVTAVSGIYNIFTNTTDTVYFFDTPRTLTISLASGGQTTTFTVWGFDEDDVFMTEQIIVSPSENPDSGKKAFAGVTRIWASRNTGTAISIGTTNIIGIPYVLDNVNRILGTGNFGTGNTFGAVATYAIADLTSPATATTGDIRGTVTLPSAADGIKRLNVAWIMTVSNTEINQQTYNTVYGVTQYAAPYN